MLADEFPPFREGQYVVQEKRWLQQPRDFIGPQDDPVKSVELAGVVKRVENERYQAENVKVRRAHGGPAPQQHIKTDAQVNERDQPQPIVHGALGRSQHHFHIQRNRAADQRVGGLRPDTGVVELARHRRRRVDRAAVDADNLVLAADSGPLCWTVWFQSIRHQVAISLNPPRAVVGNRRLMLGLVIETGKKHGRHCE